MKNFLYDAYESNNKKRKDTTLEYIKSNKFEHQVFTLFWGNSEKAMGKSIEEISKVKILKNAQKKDAQFTKKSPSNNSNQYLSIFNLLSDTNQTNVSEDEPNEKKKSNKEHYKVKELTVTIDNKGFYHICMFKITIDTSFFYDFVFTLDESIIQDKKNITNRINNNNNHNVKNNDTSDIELNEYEYKHNTSHIGSRGNTITRPDNKRLFENDCSKKYTDQGFYGGVNNKLPKTQVYNVSTHNTYNDDLDINFFDDIDEFEYKIINFYTIFNSTNSKEALKKSQYMCALFENLRQMHYSIAYMNIKQNINDKFCNIQQQHDNIKPNAQKTNVEYGSKSVISPYILTQRLENTLGQLCNGVYVIDLQMLLSIKYEIFNIKKNVKNLKSEFKAQQKNNESSEIREDMPTNESKSKIKIKKNVKSIDDMEDYDIIKDDMTMDEYIKKLESDVLKIEFLKTNYNLQLQKEKNKILNVKTLEIVINKPWSFIFYLPLHLMRQLRIKKTTNNFNFMKEIYNIVSDVFNCISLFPIFINSVYENKVHVTFINCGLDILDYYSNKLSSKENILKLIKKINISRKAQGLEDINMLSDIDCKMLSNECFKTKCDNFYNKLIKDLLMPYIGHIKTMDKNETNYNDWIKNHLIIINNDEFSNHLQKTAYLFYIENGIKLKKLCEKNLTQWCDNNNNTIDRKDETNENKFQSLLENNEIYLTKINVKTLVP